MDESVLRKKIESIGLAKTLESMDADDLIGNGGEQFDLKYEIEKLPEHLRKEAVEQIVERVNAQVLDWLDGPFIEEEGSILDLFQEYIDLKLIAKKIKEFAKEKESCRYIHYLAYSLFDKSPELIEPKTVVEITRCVGDRRLRAIYYEEMKKRGVDEDIIKCLIE